MAERVVRERLRELERADDLPPRGAPSPLVTSAVHRAMNVPHELPKNFDPASFEMRWYRLQEEAGLFRPEAAGPDAVPYVPRHPAAERDRNASTSGTRSDGRSRTSSAAGGGCRDAPCSGCPGVDHAGIATQMVVERDLKERTGKIASRHRTREVPRDLPGVGRRAPGRHPEPDPAPRLVVRFLARLLHARRAALEGRAPRLHDPLPPGPRLPGGADGELVPALRDRPLGPRGEPRRAVGPPLVDRAIRSRTAPASSSSPRRAPRRCSATRRWPSTPRTIRVPPTRREEGASSR